MKKPKAKISEPQTNENETNNLENCKFNLQVKDGTTSLHLEGTLWGVAEAIANVAVQKEEVMEMMKMVTYMLAMHEINGEEDSEEKDNKKDIMAAMFGAGGEA